VRQSDVTEHRISEMSGLISKQPHDSHPVAGWPVWIDEGTQDAIQFSNEMLLRAQDHPRNRQ